jgi:hypothetical protein
MHTINVQAFHSNSIIKTLNFWSDNGLRISLGHLITYVFLD